MDKFSSSFGSGHTRTPDNSNRGLYRLLSGDTSNLGKYPSTVGWMHSEPLYNHKMFVGGSYHWHIHDPNRMDCDDFPAHTGEGAYTGTWHAYVR